MTMQNPQQLQHLKLLMQIDQMKKNKAPEVISNPMP